MSQILRASQLKVNANVIVGPLEGRENYRLIPLTNPQTQNGKLYLQVDARNPEKGSRIPPFVGRPNKKGTTSYQFVGDVDDEDVIGDLKRLEAEILKEVVQRAGSMLGEEEKAEATTPWKILSQGNIKDTDTGDRFAPSLKIRIPTVDKQPVAKFTDTEGGAVDFEDLAQYNWQSILMELTHVWLKPSGKWGVLKTLKQVNLVPYSVPEDEEQLVMLPVSKKRKR
jgi:hypothetical protein